MRALTGSGVYVADKLFATLDTTVRLLEPPTEPPILVGDTVGFIKKLPHQLVASFRAAGSRQEQPMTVMIIGTDLVLQGQTADGVLTLVLGRQNDADSAGRVSGRWAIADRQGALRGKPRG